MSRPRPFVTLLLLAALAGCAGPSQDAAQETYTLEDVAQHADASSCWTVVDGAVHDVTDYVTAHPGGEGLIESMCGRDATEDFAGQHEGESTVAKVLDRYRIGTLG